MAPTEILAEQHRRVLAEFLRPFRVQPVVLTGRLPTRDKERVRAGLAAGDIPLVIGTHALVQETTRFADLAVAVVDEQHRFGVLQRAALAGKGCRPHLFVMTATPIPRTLALVLYGDCDISVLDELPRGRRPPVTTLLRKQDRERAYRAIPEAVTSGQQAFVVCPLIEESESLQADAARQRHEELSGGVLKGVRVGLLHGRLRPDIAASVIEQFRRRELDVLVATTVIEVGVDVPSATVMVIEDAERFGLAQLHQLRGRVGRGAERGACYLVSSAGRDDPAWERLSLLESTSDGFEVAEADLRMRGPGELIGTRQAGLPDLRMTDLLSDTALIEMAREDAFALVAADPTLSRPEHGTLRHVIHRQIPTLLPLMRGD
jgi:ATP-dependent DNA helicase RecG